MGDPDDEALEDALARARDRTERYGVWLEHLRGGDPAFAEASALYPPDMRASGSRPCACSLATSACGASSAAGSCRSARLGR